MSERWKEWSWRDPWMWTASVTAVCVTVWSMELAVAMAFAWCARDLIASALERRKGSGR